MAQTKELYRYSLVQGYRSYVEEFSKEPGAGFEIIQALE
jgi:hypothetical protein